MEYHLYITDDSCTLKDQSTGRFQKYSTNGRDDARIGAALRACIFILNITIKIHYSEL